MTTLVANGYRIGDRYTLLGKLGEGGESEVWRARDHLHGREVALKVLRPEIASRPGAWEALERQHDISRRLDHPLILRIDPPLSDGEMLVLPMELAPGGDLRRLCGVSYLEILPVLIEVAQALAHAHERGVVHRDLKPANVLFDSRGHVRLADFGAAPSDLSPFTASPQQLRGEPSTAADDIYGLGALAYELLGGHPPFYPRFDRRRVLEEPVPPLKPAHLAPGRLVALVMAMLAKQARERPASMRDVLDRFDMALNDTLTFAYDDKRDALAPTDEILPEPEEDEADPPVSASPRAGGPAAPERPTPSDGPSASDRPAAVERPALAAAQRPAPAEHPPITERARAPERPVMPEHSATSERPTAPPPPRPPLITPVAQGTPSAPRAAAHATAFREAPPTAAPQPAQPAPFAAAAASAPPHVAPAPAAPVAPLRAVHAHDDELRALWGDIRVERMPTLMKIEQVRRARWPWAFVAGVAAAAIAMFVLLHGSVRQGSWVRPSAEQLRAALAPPAVVQAVRGAVEAPLRAMRNGSPTTSGSGTSGSAPQSLPGGSDAAPPSAAVSPTTGSPPTTAIPQTTIPVPAPVQPRAVTAGRSASGSPASRSGAAQRGRSNPAVQSLLSDARAAETAREYSRAAQDYSQALALDPRNPTARAGLQRANETFGASEYSQAVGSGFAALGAGRLEEARADFQRARSVNPRGDEAALGLREVAAALKTRDAAAARYRERTDLESRLQNLVDDPRQLNSAAVRADAASLIRQAETMPSASPVLRSLAARLTILLPGYDKPVHLALVSDNLTEIEIPEIGSFGTFARRDLDLKPGKYTVIGTRAGYRDVRRDVTVAPGQDLQTISVRCEVPI